MTNELYTQRQPNQLCIPSGLQPRIKTVSPCQPPFLPRCLWSFLCLWFLLSCKSCSMSLFGVQSSLIYFPHLWFSDLKENSPAFIASKFFKRKWTIFETGKQKWRRKNEKDECSHTHRDPVPQPFCLPQSLPRQKPFGRAHHMTALVSLPVVSTRDLIKHSTQQAWL